MLVERKRRRNNETGTGGNKKHTKKTLRGDRKRRSKRFGAGKKR